MGLYTLSEKRATLIMDEKTFINLLADCTISCSWCDHQCNDADKYEMLVTCISIQKEFLNICRMAASIIGKNISGFIKNLFHIFEHMIDHCISKYLAQNNANTRMPHNFNNKYFSLGCSQIFQISQLIESLYTANLHKND